MANNVVFPEPEGTTKEMGFPRSTDKFISLTIVKGPSGLLTSFVMFLTSKIRSFNGCLGVFLAILLSVFMTVNASESLSLNENTIVVLGDSLSAGYGVKAEESWPSLLENTLKKNNPNLSVINAGISGDTTSGGFRLPLLLKKHQPKIVILELGGNDGLRGMSIKRVIKKNLEQMINMIHASGSIVVMIGVELPPNYGELYTSSFKKMYVDLANEYNINLVKGSLLEMVSSNLMQSDGIHPNQAGHVLIEQEVLKEIVPILFSVTD